MMHRYRVEPRKAFADSPGRSTDQIAGGDLLLRVIHDKVRPSGDRVTS
jgi:hypothetical protein